MLADIVYASIASILRKTGILPWLGHDQLKGPDATFEGSGRGTAGYGSYSSSSRMGGLDYDKVERERQQRLAREAQKEKL